MRAMFSLNVFVNEPGMEMSFWESTTPMPFTATLTMPLTSSKSFAFVLYSRR